MKVYLPDTNACSWFMRGHDQLVARWIDDAAFVQLSVIVVAELEFGVFQLGTARQRARLDEFTATLPVQPFVQEDTKLYGRLRAELQRRGEIIGPLDLLIAAQALRLGATLVTHNVREFRRVPGLKVEDWQTAPATP